MRDARPCLEKTVESSLNRYIDLKRPLLLALSGGPDSMALLGLLLDYKKRHPFSLFAVYVDHQWRAESGKEAQEVQRYTENLGVPFFIHTLNGAPFNEEVARIGRLECFRMLMQQTGSQAVCLAHHRDDQEETLIKRLFEGAGLTQLQGMQEFSKREDGLCLWRPLLPHRKQELLLYNEEKQIPHWKDGTNEDERFLRARMRQTLIPLLRAHFGKEIGSALHHLGHEAQELQSYLQARSEEEKMHIHQGPLGIFWEWPERLPDPYILRYILRKITKQWGITLSREEIQRAQRGLSEKKAHHQIRNGERKLFVDRGRLFLLEATKLAWDVSWQQQESCNEVCLSDWRLNWGGPWQARLTPGSYVMRMPHIDDQMLWKGAYKRCQEVWRDCRVPQGLRERMPVIVECSEAERGVMNACALEGFEAGRVVAQFLVPQPQVLSKTDWLVQVFI